MTTLVMEAKRQHEHSGDGMKERPILFTPENAQKCCNGTKTQTRRIVKDPDYHGCLTGDCPHWDKQLCAGFMEALCPYGIVGDRMWVRETWAAYTGGMTDCGEEWDEVEGTIDLEFCSPVVVYKGTRESRPAKWRPSIYMPRWACRTVLEIAEIRVQRLQEITPDDARAEGCDDEMCAKGAFEELWESINGAGSWAANPWVWAISFKKVQP